MDEIKVDSEGTLVVQIEESVIRFIDLSLNRHDQSTIPLRLEIYYLETAFVKRDKKLGIQTHDVGKDKDLRIRDTRPITISVYMGGKLMDGASCLNLPKVSENIDVKMDEFDNWKRTYPEMIEEVISIIQRSIDNYNDPLSKNEWPIVAQPYTYNKVITSKLMELHDKFAK